MCAKRATDRANSPPHASLAFALSPTLRVHFLEMVVFVVGGADGLTQRLQDSGVVKYLLGRGRSLAAAVVIFFVFDVVFLCSAENPGPAMSAS